MAELDAVIITNPTDEDFTYNYNGEPYTIKAHETRPFAKYVAFHLAKHLSSKMISEHFEAEEEKASKKKDFRKEVFATKVAQQALYDNPLRRRTLYQILGNKELVEQTVAAYPFKGFVGEMREYQEFVEREEARKLSLQGATA